MADRRPVFLLLVAPALTMVLVLFVYPLGYSLVSAFTTRDGHASLDNFAKTFELYGTDIVFTLVIVVASTALIGLFAAAIGGYLVLGAHPAAVKSQLDEATWQKLFVDVTPQDLATKGKPFPIAPYFNDILESYERKVQ